MLFYSIYNDFGSFSDALYRSLLVSIVETVPIGNVVDHFVSKVLFSCLKLSQKIDSSPSEIGDLL